MGWVSLEVQKILQERSVEPDCLDWQFNNLFQVSCWWSKAHIIETWDCETFKRTDCSIVMVLWIWAFCTIFLSNYFTVDCFVSWCFLVWLVSSKLTKWVAKTSIRKATIPFVLVRLMVCFGWQTGCQIFGREWMVYFSWVAYQPFFYWQNFAKKRFN